MREFNNDPAAECPCDDTRIARRDQHDRTRKTPEIPDLPLRSRDSREVLGGVKASFAPLTASAALTRPARFQHRAFIGAARIPGAPN